MQFVYDNHTAVRDTHEIVNSFMKLFIRKTTKIGLDVDTWFWSIYIYVVYYVPWSDVEFIGCPLDRAITFQVNPQRFPLCSRSIFIT